MQDPAAPAGRQYFWKSANYTAMADETLQQIAAALHDLPTPQSEIHLQHMGGAVAQWVADCWRDEYTAAPADGSPWVEGNCNGRVVRGGSWEDSQGELRSAARTAGAKDDQFYTDGLRIARNL